MLYLGDRIVDILIDAVRTWEAFHTSLISDLLYSLVVMHSLYLFPLIRPTACPLSAMRCLSEQCVLRSGFLYIFLWWSLLFFRVPKPEQSQLHHNTQTGIWLSMKYLWTAFTMHQSTEFSIGYFLLHLFVIKTSSMPEVDRFSGDYGFRCCALKNIWQTYQHSEQ